MNITIQPGKLNGTIHAIASKSQAHRLLICSAFADKPTELVCQETNRDIEATVDCLNALGANVLRTKNGYHVTPVHSLPTAAVLDCCESGSTLRFMLPIAGALGVDTTFLMAGRLPQRPLSPLWEEMEHMGCTLSRPTANTIRCTGQLRPGKYVISGNISSQYITGILFAMALMPGHSSLEITGKLESKPYVHMTRMALSAFGVDTANNFVTECTPLRSPTKLHVEGDWSNGAFFLAAQALGNLVTVEGLDANSPQGDRAVAQILDTIANIQTVSAADIPDLIPILSVAAAANNGCTFTDIQRLRMKESDRVASVIHMLAALGINAVATDSTLTVYSGSLTGGVVDAANDHRIAMSAAIAATIASGPVTILGAECVSKSYPTFWDEYRRLGGNYEQYIR